MYRKGSLNDCKWVYELICDMECTKLPYEKFYEIYKQQIDNINYYCIICEHNDEVIGVSNLRFEQQLHHSECIAEIMEFSINPLYRNKGIGKEMFEEACKIAKNRNCIQIEVACNNLRKDTHRFYLREGMNNFHFKFSKSLNGDNSPQNKIGK